MSTDVGTGLILLAMCVHLAIGFPLFAVLGVGSLSLILWTGQYSVSVLGEAPFQAMDNWALLAMPLFILSGDIVSSGKMAKAIVGMGQALVGWVRGGLGMTTIAACFFFAGTSGSNAADTAAVGRIMIPRLVERGYPIDYAAALAAAGGCMGIIVPPSLMFIIYGVITSTSVGDLFLAGILPGLVMALLMCLSVYIEVRVRGIGGTPEPFSLRGLGRATWDCKYGLGAPAIILGGIYSGVFTPTEAAAVAVMYCIFIEHFVNRAVTWRDLGGLLARSAVIVGIIGPVIIFSLMFGEVIALLRLPEAIANFFLRYASGPNTFLLATMLLLLLVGCFMETIAALIIIMPILMPIVTAMKVDPVHFGVFVVCALTVGFITPPVGLNLFVASAISGRPYMLIAKRVVPLFLALVAATALVGWVPWLTLWFRS